MEIIGPVAAVVTGEDIPHILFCNEKGLLYFPSRTVPWASAFQAQHVCTHSKLMQPNSSSLRIEVPVGEVMKWQSWIFTSLLPHTWHLTRHVDMLLQNAMINLLKSKVHELVGISGFMLTYFTRTYCVVAAWHEAKTMEPQAFHTCQYNSADH